MACRTTMLMPAPQNVHRVSHNLILSGYSNPRRVAAWVREMSDEESLIRLVASNAQGEMSPLGVGEAGGRVVFQQGAIHKTLCMEGRRVRDASQAV